MAPAGRLILGLIVEGHGDEIAAPILIRRIAQDSGVYRPIHCQPWRISRSKLVRPKELERTIETLTREIGRGQPVLVLLDADKDCPKELAAILKNRCQAAHSDVRVSIVIAKKEYEAWFLAAARSLSSQGQLASGVSPHEDPESVRGAKEWLTDHMTSRQSYSEARHQAAFSACIDLAEARRARSFRKFEKEVRALLE